MNIKIVTPEPGTDTFLLCIGDFQFRLTKKDLIDL